MPRRLGRCVAQPVSPQRREGVDEAVQFPRLAMVMAELAADVSTVPDEGARGVRGVFRAAVWFFA